MDYRSPELPRFKNSQEELAYLKEQIRLKEEEIKTRPEGFLEAPDVNSIESEEQARKEAVEEFKNLPKDQVLEETHAFSGEEIEQISLALDPEKHDTIMQELLWVLEERGIMNALSVVNEMNNPHIEDDFHRVLVQYLKSPQTKDYEKETKSFPALRMVLFEVLLPEASKEDLSKGFGELISGMQQFYAGMTSVRRQSQGFFSAVHGYFTLELALPESASEVSFFASVSEDDATMFEKQVLSAFPDARIEETPDDYNVFNEDGVSVGAYAKPAHNAIFPLRTYDSFENDPLNVLLGVFSRLAGKGEGLAVQIVVAPAGDALLGQYKEALRKVREGVKVREAIDIPRSAFGGFLKSAKSVVTGPTKPTHHEGEKMPVDEQVVENIKKKIDTALFDTNIRIVASAETRPRAQRIMDDALSSFHQFTDPQAGEIQFKKLEKRKLDEMFHQFSFRLLSGAQSYPLNAQELTTLFHFPVGKTSLPELKRSRASSAPLPMNTSQKGIVLGTNTFRGETKEVRFSTEDRMRHFYALGQTGTGKTTLLKNMIIQDIQNGEGVCMIDPHGTDIEDILGNIPRERLEDVVYFDPGNTERPLGLNMLEYDTRFPEQKTFVVNEMLSIFNKLFDMKVAGGPAFEQFFRNSALLVMEDPASGNTLLEIGRVLGDKAFRDMKLSRAKNPIIKQFWANAEKTTGEQSLANFVPYITNKFDVFITNDIMRPIIAQERSAFNFRRIMDERKILLVNLSKGRLGDINSNLLGLIIVGKILMASLSRVDALAGERPADFFLYIDEFQNVTTDSISTILSEARKYRLSLTVAHQFIAQLDEKIRDAVFGNVGSLATFRIGAEDAEFMEKFFDPVFHASDMMNLENRNAYVKMLVEGEPVKPFNIKTLPPHVGDSERAQKIKEYTALKYGRPREDVERDILERYQK